MPRLILAAVALLLLVVPLAAGDSGDAPKVAVLRMRHAIESMKSFKARIDVLNQDHAAFRARLKEYEEQIQRLTTAVQALPAGNEKLGQLQEELEATKARREAFGRRVSGEIEQRNIAIANEQYKVARVLLAEFCKQRGIRLVVKAADDDIAARQMELLLLRMEAQTALYWDADQDITDAFIGYANQRFLDKVNAPEPAPAPEAAPGPAPTPAPEGK